MPEAKWHWKEIIYDDPIEAIPLQIITEGAVATTTLADGRLLPVLLLDCSSRADVEDLMKAHRYVTPGDAKVNWGKSSKKADKIKMILFFEKPSKCTAVLEFDILKQGGIVDQIMRCEAVILQCAKEGDKLISTLDSEKLIVEVPSRQAWAIWNEELFRALEKDGRRKGMSKKETKKYAGKVITGWRDFTDHRKQSG